MVYIKTEFSIPDVVEAHLKAADLLLNDPEDILLINIAAYHLQQAVENALKYRLRKFNMKPPRIHDVAVLMYMLKSLGDDIPTWLSTLAPRITGYAVRTRYRSDVVVEAHTIRPLIQPTRDLLNLKV